MSSGDRHPVPSQYGALGVYPRKILETPRSVEFSAKFDSILTAGELITECSREVHVYPISYRRFCGWPGGKWGFQPTPKPPSAWFRPRI